MSRLDDIKGTLRIFWSMTKDEFDAMDHKIIRIVGMILTLLIFAYFWFNFFSHIMPF